MKPAARVGSAAVLAACLCSSLACTQESSLPEGVPYLIASPNPVRTADGLGSTTITWSTGRNVTGRVFVSVDDRPESEFASGSAGSQTAPWISWRSRYRFTLYVNREPVAVITVTREPIEDQSLGFLTTTLPATGAARGLLYGCWVAFALLLSRVLFVRCRRSAAPVPDEPSGGLLRLTGEWDLILMYMSLTAALSLHLGQDMNWDLRNYHFYNPYQLLNGRFDFDIAAAGIQSYINPLLDLPFYLAVKGWDLWPPLIGLALGALHGLNLWFVHAITVSLLPAARQHAALWAGLAAAITAAFGAGFHGEIGSTMGDNLMSLPVLASVLVFIQGTRGDRAQWLRSSLVAGFLMGAAVGAKLVAAAYGIGLGVAGIATRGLVRERALWLSRYVLLAAVGVLLTAGYWCWLMVLHYGSPLFPFYNAIFRSPLVPAVNLIDERFLPGSFSEALAYPVLFAFPQQLASELVFADARLALALAIIAAIGGHVFVRRWKGSAVADPALSTLAAVAVFWVVAYVLWLGTFSIYRYAVPLELLSPALAMASFYYWIPDSRRALAAVAAICGTLIVFTRAPDWHRIPWSDSYFAVNEEQLSHYADATVLLADMPSAYLIPFFPSSTRFLRLRGAWHLDDEDSLMRRRLDGDIRSSAADRLFVLETSPLEDSGAKRNALGRLGLQLEEDKCEEISTTAETARLCAVSTGVLGS